MSKIKAMNEGDCAYVQGGLVPMRRVVHEGQTPRPLQEKATLKSCPQSSQRARAKMPHSRYFSNAWRT